MAIDISATVATLRAIAGVAKDANKIDVLSQVIELQTQILEIQEEIRCLREENAALRAQADVRGQVRFAEGLYWMGPDQSESSGPFCPRCYDIEGRLVRLADHGVVFFCHEHQGNYDAPGGGRRIGR